MSNYHELYRYKKPRKFRKVNWQDRKLIQEAVIHSTSIVELFGKLNLQNAGSNYKTLHYWLDKHKISITHFEPKYAKINRLNRTKTLKYEDIFCENSTIAQAVLRRYYKQENVEYKCVLCNQLPEWNNEILTLQLDHINGSNRDNRFENLRWLCPNCHTQTPTHGSKKR